ncbi:MAG TPA: hypothetical protein VE130_13820 [Nitrososphaeraceae archaeon]|nr:hypothetical protein [Nitrososphaeraceae archaeon]
MVLQDIATNLASIIQNMLTVVSFLIGTCSFILGLTIQNASKLSHETFGYLRMLILAMVIPSVVTITYGVILVGSGLKLADITYLLLLFVLYVPAGVIILLLTKTHSIISK